jgi:hypothetical protein
MTAGKTLYVAETDDAGQIACVWYTEPGAKAARPVRTPTRHLALLGGAQCYGASAQDIDGWLKSQANQHPHG